MWKRCTISSPYEKLQEWGLQICSLKFTLIRLRNETVMAVVKWLASRASKLANPVRYPWEITTFRVPLNMTVKITKADDGLREINIAVFG